MRLETGILGAGLSVLLMTGASATPLFSTGNPDGQMATASRPDAGGKIEIESADDFVFNNAVSLSSATFTGLITGGGTIGDVSVAIYRVFPLDSTNPPDGRVPTRANSPSDVEFASRDAGGGTLSFTSSVLSNSFTATNSVLNGINPVPNQTTGGEGAVTGQEVQFTATFTTPIDLQPDHYFFVPEVQITGGEFYWLSATRPIVAPGTPFSPDLQEWIRNANLDPDWLRVGTDIVGGTTPPMFNANFSLDGTDVPEPGSLAILGSMLLLGMASRRRQRRSG